MVLMAKLRRKTTLAILLLGYTIAMLLCNICMPRNALVVLLFVARGMSNGASQGAFVYTTEVYPTSVRAIGIGWNTSMTRVGVIITPFIAQMMIRTSAYIPITTYAVLGFIGCIAVVLLPIETAKRKMTDTLEEQSD
ncbi:synaptic vesicle 2-related protein isoform X2 [Aplysia californica]|uniref:Synaptic vesicle 2-related protein isoform X2 n=1 Tax=Aplysia californica TaxID=6500 RepID=A0ABM0ZUX8_APLCA|nr:synaptic vesicle 2-related protein isoform X2 [Aplysia californica]